MESTAERSLIMGHASSLMYSLTTVNAPALAMSGLEPARKMAGAANQSVHQRRANPMAMIQRLMPPTREINDNTQASRCMAMKLGVTRIM
jgi:hypothetical protein